MAKFKYVARDNQGKAVNGVIDAGDSGSAGVALRGRGLTVLSVSAAGGLFKAGAAKEAKARARTADLALFTRQFATMLNAGLPVMECLDILTEQIDDPGFKACLNRVRGDVRGGSDLSGAMGKFAKAFPPLYTNMVRAGEASGQLDTIFQRLADYLEANERLKRKIKSAMTYPVVSLGLVACITIFLLVYIVPQFKDMFEKLGATLPLPTRMVMSISAFLTSWVGGGLSLLAVVGLFVTYRTMRKTPAGRLAIDSAFLKTPVFGPLFQKVAVGRFARTFATMLKSGVAILQSLDIVAATSGNAVLERVVEDAKQGVRQGQMLAEPLAKHEIFPPMVVRMIATGEKSGALEVLLEKVAEFYDEQVDAGVESLTAMIEPIMLGVMGVVVGGIVLSIFLPILELQQSIGKKR